MRFTVSFIFMMIACLGFSQKTKVQGVIKDAITNEPIVGAIIIYGEGKNTSTDIDGAFSFSVDSGSYLVKASYIGYKAIERRITAKGKPVFVDFTLSTNELAEVEVTTDIAIQRETPVAFSNIDTKKIQEDLGSRDLPLILNSTPGVYATSQGGGDGDARVSIRGFNSQNVLVLLDGIPMNDMVNGRVFWTNWFGLDNLSRGMQVQRGLGATKLAIPSIGGTINILTAGIDSKRAISVKNEYGNNNNYRLGLSYSSGRMKNGWAFNFAGSYKRNDGWFDNMSSRMWFYYGKVEKKIGAHLISFTAFGAPQTSAQRDFRVNYNVSAYNKEFAYNLGIDTVGKREYGWRYNPSWNYLARTKDNPQAAAEVYNTSVNKFHKPVISLKDFIVVNEKLTISTIAYASFGRGYGTQLDGGSAGNNLIPTTGQQNVQGIYDANTSPTQTVATGENFSSSWVRVNHNDHDWYGGLVTANYKLRPSWTLSGGLDGRLYKGLVYSTFGDLLGGDLVKNFNPDQNNAPGYKYEGDKYVQNIERRVRWLGGFAMAEYKKDKWSGFVNLSYATSLYKQINYFLPKQLVSGDNKIDVPYGVTVQYDGKSYDNSSPELKYNQTAWKQLNGYTAKAGANYNLTEHMNVFVNVGYLNRVPFITYVYRTDNKEFDKVNNEEIKSVELGYSYSTKYFSANINGYYTLWNNRPTTANFTINGESVSTTATGMNARHQGIEFDGIYKINRKLNLELMATVADWEWTSIATATIMDNDGNVISVQKFDPRGVKVGDAAQNTAGLSLRYEPIKKLYIKPQLNYFGKNYANFSPDALVITNAETGYGPNIGRQSWRMPDYLLMDFSAGYSFPVKKVNFDIRGSVMNVLNQFYISDAQDNNLNTQNFNAPSATVNVGMGRRWLLTLVATF